MVAFARFAIARVTSVPAALSPVLTTAHDGSVFHAGGPDGSENTPPRLGAGWRPGAPPPRAAGSPAKTAGNFAGATSSSTAVAVPSPVGYVYCFSAGLSALSVEPFSPSASTSPCSAGKPFTYTSARTFLAPVAALLITAPP